MIIFSQELPEGDKPAEVEVTILSSDSEPLPQKSRRTVRKYQFSHPYAQLDPNFLLKKQQHEALRRTTRVGGNCPPTSTYGTGAPSTLR